MSELILQLGLDWKLLIAQTINFLIVFLVIRFLFIKQLLPLLKNRQKTIAEGIEKAQEADVRLHAITQLQKEKIKEAESQAQLIIKNAQEKAFNQQDMILRRAQEKEQEIVEIAKKNIATKEAEALDRVERQAVGLVKQLLVKTVSLSPEAIDDGLIKSAAKSLRMR